MSQSASATPQRSAACQVAPHHDRDPTHPIAIEQPDPLITSADRNSCWHSDPLDMTGLSGIVDDTAQEAYRMAKLYYTPREAAEMLAISDDAVLDLIKRGDIPALRISPRITRIPIVAFDRWREGYRPRRRRVSIAPARRRVEVGAEEKLPVPSELATH
jgi:excisionase family DNA binding protein